VQGQTGQGTSTARGSKAAGEGARPTFEASQDTNQCRDAAVCLASHLSKTAKGGAPSVEILQAESWGSRPTQAKTGLEWATRPGVVGG
jgi:hypothetical protein